MSLITFSQKIVSPYIPNLPCPVFIFFPLTLTYLKIPGQLSYRIPSNLICLFPHDAIETCPLSSITEKLNLKARLDSA